MPNWSIERIHIGRLNTSPLEILSRLQFHFEADREPYAIQRVLCFKHAVVIEGGGRRHAPLPITAECWAWLRAGIVVTEFADEGSHEVDRYVVINNELVYQDQVRDDEPQPPLAFKPRNDYDAALMQTVIDEEPSDAY